VESSLIESSRSQQSGCGRIFDLLFDSNQFFTSGFQLSFAVVGHRAVGRQCLFALNESCPDPFFPRLLLSPDAANYAAVGRGLAPGASVSLAAWIGSLLLIYWYFYLVDPGISLRQSRVVPIAYFVLALVLAVLITAPILRLSILFNMPTGECRARPRPRPFLANAAGGHVYLRDSLNGMPPTYDHLLRRRNRRCAHIPRE